MDQIAGSLVRQQCYVNGEWTGDPVVPVLDPATGEELARVPNFGAAETSAAIDAAHAAFPELGGDAGEGARGGAAPLV